MGNKNKQGPDRLPTGLDRLPSGAIRVRITYENRLYTVGTFATVAEAVDARIVAKADIQRGYWRPTTEPLPVEPITVVPQAPTFAEVAEAWLARREHEVNMDRLSIGTLSNDRTSLNKWLIPAFGHLPITELTRLRASDWRTNRENDPACRPSALRIAWVTLAALLRDARDEMQIPNLPEGVTRIRDAWADVSNKPPIGSSAELEAVFAHLPEGLQVPLRVMFGARLRVGELCGLNAEHVELAEGRVWIAQQYRDGFRVDHRVQPPKNRRRRDDPRPAYLMPSALDALRQYLADSPRIGQAPLFPGARSERLRPTYVRDKWNMAVQAAGVPDALRLHSVRGTGLDIIGHLDGVSTTERMAQGRHKTERAAGRYQSNRDDRAREIAQQAESYHRAELDSTDTTPVASGGER